MTAHYSVTQVVEIREALEKITDENHANNVSLASIIREAKVPHRSKTARSGVGFRPLMLQQESGAPGRIRTHDPLVRRRSSENC